MEKEQANIAGDLLRLGKPPRQMPVIVVQVTNPNGSFRRAITVTVKMPIVPAGSTGLTIPQATRSRSF